MSALGAPMAALGGQLVMFPHNSSFSSGIQLRNRQSAGWRRQRVKCMGLANEQVKVLDADSGGDLKSETSPSNDTEKKSKESESLPLLKPSPKPMMPPARPKPVMSAKPSLQQANGTNTNNSTLRTRPPGESFNQFNQVYRPKENGSNLQQQGGGGAVQNLDKILQNAERLGSVPIRRQMPAVPQPTGQQNPAFQTRWKKGDPTTPVPKPQAQTQAPAQAQAQAPAQTQAPAQAQAQAQAPAQTQAPAPPPPPPQAQAQTQASDVFKTQLRPQMDAARQQQARAQVNSPYRPQQQAPNVKPPPPIAPREQEPPASAPQQQASPSTSSDVKDASQASGAVSPVKSDASRILKDLRPVTPPRTPILSSPPLIRPKPVVKPEPQMISKPIMAPRPAPSAAAPPQSKGPRLIDSFRKPMDQAPSAPAQQAKGQGAKTREDKDMKKLQEKTGGKKQGSIRDVAMGSPSSKPGYNKARDDKRKKVENVDGAKRRVNARQEHAIEDAEELGVSISGVKTSSRKYIRARQKAEREEAAKAAAPVRVEILEVGKQGMLVGDLAFKLALTPADVVKALFMKGIAVTINQMLDEESVKIVCKELEVEVIEAGTVKVEEMAKKQKEFLDEEDLDSLELRPPVVTVMGHVDHGKTSLLDYIRKSKVAAGEAGGITQGIGAYQVKVNVDGEEQRCVFLDTPGHQAFSAMRARGARITDIAIIVVAADDSVRPQTLEAIAHAKAAKVPIVVAINKIDKPGANIDRVKEDLAKAGVVPPEWGGEEQMIPVSAITGENIDTLLETLMLVAELQDLRSNPKREASGTIIEASLDKTRGPIATLLVQNGTLKRGDVVLCGESYGKVRALFDDRGKSVVEAGPSSAVRVIGLSTVPLAGDEFEVRKTIDEARNSAAEYAERMREARLASQASEGKVTLASLANAVAAGRAIGVESQQLNIVLKVDVQGSVEAIREALQVLPQDTVQLRFLMQAPGDITSSDIDLAIASGAIVIAFNVGSQPTVAEKAESEGVEIRSYKVIYELVDEMRQAMEGLLKPLMEEVPIGKAEVRATFSSGSGRVAGCMVTEGKLKRGCGLHVERRNKIVYTGTLSSLRRVRELAKEIDSGSECGVGVDGFDEWQEGDIVQAFDRIEKKRTLEDASATVTAALASSKQ